MDMNEWASAGKYGLWFQEHENKTTGVGRTKRPLRYYASVYKWKQKTVTDVYGWEGAGPEKLNGYFKLSTQHLAAAILEDSI